MSADDNIVLVESLVKTYRDGENDVAVLKDLNLSLNRGDFLSIRGASGAGKSTLLNILGALDRFDEGNVEIAGVKIQEQNPKKLHSFRRDSIGFVFQHHYLLPEFSIQENVMMPLLLQKTEKKIAAERAAAALEQVGLSHRLHFFPSQISGGESQRAAVARAFVHHPPLILADEPTGNLDSDNTAKFIDILTRLIDLENLTVLVVTHENDLAEQARRRCYMKDGILEG